DISAVARRSRSAENLVDVRDFDLLAERPPVDPISISEQIFRRGVERKGFEHLLRCPFGCGVSRDVEVDNSSSIISQNNKGEEDFKANRVDGEEVERGELRYVVIEERSPGLRGWFRIANHVFGNGSLRDLDTQLHELAVNPRCAPNRILTAHGSYQITSLL